LQLVHLKLSSIDYSYDSTVSILQCTLVLSITLMITVSILQCTAMYAAASSVHLCAD
jgi:hypothetical protein